LPENRFWMRFDVKPDGGIANGKMFFQVPKDAPAGNPDGLKVDRKGNLYCAGPAGVWIFDPRVSTWEASSRRRFPPTWLGAAKTAATSTLRPARASIASG